MLGPGPRGDPLGLHVPPQPCCPDAHPLRIRGWKGCATAEVEGPSQFPPACDPLRCCFWSRHHAQSWCSHVRGQEDTHGSLPASTVDLHPHPARLEVGPASLFRTQGVMASRVPGASKRGFQTSQHQPLCPCNLSPGNAPVRSLRPAYGHVPHAAKTQSE